MIIEETDSFEVEIRCLWDEIKDHPEECECTDCTEFIWLTQK